VRFRRLLLAATITAAIASVLTTTNATAASTRSAGSYQEIELRYQAWSVIASGRPAWAFWNTSPTPPLAPVGRCFNLTGECNGLGETWSYFQFDTSMLQDKVVVDAYFLTAVEYSPTCDTRIHQLVRAAGPIYPSTTWNTRVKGDPKNEVVINYDADVANPGRCPGAKAVTVDVPTPEINPRGPTTFILKAADPGDSYAWRKYNPATTTLWLRVWDPAQ
jgi:hypothetical protein